MIVEITIRNDAGAVVHTQREPLTAETDGVGVDLSREGAIVLDERTFLRGWEWKPRLVRLPAATEIAAPTAESSAGRSYPARISVLTYRPTALSRRRDFVDVPDPMVWAEAFASRFAVRPRVTHDEEPVGVSTTSRD